MTGSSLWITTIVRPFWHRGSSERRNLSVLFSTLGNEARIKKLLGIGLRDWKEVGLGEEKGEEFDVFVPSRRVSELVVADMGFR